MQTLAQKHMAQYPARPTATPEILLQAGKEIEEQLDEWGKKDPGVAQALTRICGGKHMNGYELAKQLEASHTLSHIDTETVEVLDNFSHEVDTLVTALEKEWERSNQVQPPHPIGTLLIEGTITGISEHNPAAYLVDEGKGHSYRLAVKYENAITATEHAQRLTKANVIALAC
ncbi:hypothetical protein [Comamonas sp.]|uniref:hypothetical protein n=1 Tax=Comamonas sp. TaxID=34028 RepID=UPI002896FACA|nr:hypothetical protein [Comamonas sp.]